MQKTLAIIFFISVGLFHSQAMAQKTLRVGYVGSPPFVIEAEATTNNTRENPEGIIFDIWQEIAFEMGRKYTLKSYSTVKAGITAVNTDIIDLLIGPITINSERAQQVTFSQSFFETEMALLAPIIESGFWAKVKPFFSAAFLYAILGLLLILTIVSTLFWVVEGRHFPDEYPHHPVKGIGMGIWLAIVTMTTVGYGDFAPKTAGGRVIMGSWMIISLILATTFIAGIATTFSQVSQNDHTITNLSQLDNKEVAVPANERALRIIRATGGNPVKVNNVDKAFSLLMEGEVDAVLYDAVQLKYVFSRPHKDDFKLTTNEIAPQQYGFIFPDSNKIAKKVNLQIIRLRESGEINNIVNSWLLRE